jgi:hypothetical protein
MGIETRTFAAYGVNLPVDAPTDLLYKSAVPDIVRRAADLGHDPYPMWTWLGEKGLSDVLTIDFVGNQWTNEFRWTLYITGSRVEVEEARPFVRLRTELDDMHLLSLQRGLELLGAADLTNAGWFMQLEVF